MSGWGLESAMTWYPLVEAGEVYIPRWMHGFRVLPPQTIHLVCIVGVSAIGKGVVGRGSAGEGVSPTDWQRQRSERPGRADEWRETADDDAPGEHVADGGGAEESI